MLLVKNLTDAADALLNKAGNWGGKDRLRAVLKKIKKDVSKCPDQGSVSLNVTCYTPLHSIFSLATFAGQIDVLSYCVKQLSKQTLLHVLLV